ncbi:uncharacterized protein AMSG_08025 [Thecamonas trahens ATCC 50062]|uniref:Uncharacterized protein n=1 Tax=Thecamonas trahens ATCC 50062 TaxID=461836 RepID=A0A0L0DM51_THETB|nr:hypothetical protein AMSG_08025 [Thecamonas trahens ATCC 50062]KNC52468.1 hypothetical protein AMSG_08025 [Thecamonas trahens ATCC 50062]|eukprot:XP_013755268.1 hypothetical protein AMSG_08025 [Thecamonas trahens ATCC 50062]
MKTTTSAMVLAMALLASLASATNLWVGYGSANGRGIAPLNITGGTVFMGPTSRAEAIRQPWMEPIVGKTDCGKAIGFMDSLEYNRYNYVEICDDAATYSKPFVPSIGYSRSWIAAGVAPVSGKPIGISMSYSSQGPVVVLFDSQTAKPVSEVDSDVAAAGRPSAMTWMTDSFGSIEGAIVQYSTGSSWQAVNVPVDGGQASIVASGSDDPYIALAQGFFFSTSKELYGLRAGSAGNVTFVTSDSSNPLDAPKVVAQLPQEIYSCASTMAVSTRTAYVLCSQRGQNSGSPNVLVEIHAGLGTVNTYPLEFASTSYAFGYLVNI